MNIHEENYCIISAHQPGNTKEQNARLQSDLLQDLVKLVGYSGSIIPTHGRYDGFKEESFAVSLPTNVSDFLKFKAAIVDIGDKYNQICMLFIVNKNKEAQADVILWPLARGVEEGIIKYSEFIWEEVDDSCAASGSTENFTCILGKYFVINTNPTESAVLEALLEILNCCDLLVEYDEYYIQ